MTRKPRAEIDPVEQEIEVALNPDAFISYHACESFVSDLEEVADSIGKLTVSDAARVVPLYETFLAGCYEKVEAIDDSGGSFGAFVGELFCGWIKARQAAGADPEETATRLVAWMDEDDYGFCHDLEKAAVKVFDKANFAAFVKLARVKFDAAAVASPKTGASYNDQPEYIRRRWGDALRTLYAAQKDVAAYVALAEETGLTAQDCLVIATLIAGRRKPEEALAWADRGIDLAGKTLRGPMAGFELARLRRELLTRLDRGSEALAEAWTGFRERPDTFTYDELMKFVPKTERAAWHEKAIAATGGADLRSVLELLLKTKEMDRLAERVRQSTDDELEGLSHYGAEPVAEALEKSHPDLAARLWCAQGMRIVNAKKSKYYDAALLNFESAKRCFEDAPLRTVNLPLPGSARLYRFSPPHTTNAIVAGYATPAMRRIRAPARRVMGLNAVMVSADRSVG
ncbi:MAG: DUF6880 family protein [Pseudomonadota bacterium]